MRASDMMLIDANDSSAADHPDMDPTAWAIHGAMHRKLPQARCIMHVHSKHALVLATLKDSRIPPIDQNTMRFFERIVIDEHFGGMGLGEEAERLPECIGDKSVLIMGNHGVIVTGPTVAETFDELYYLERACETLITAYMTGKELRVVSDEVARKTMQQWMEYPAKFATKTLRCAQGHPRRRRAVLPAVASTAPPSPGIGSSPACRRSRPVPRASRL